MQVEINEKYLHKEECIKFAKKNSFILNMDVMKCAEEVYAHAWLYYHSSNKTIKKHTKIIDLEIGGDNCFRKIVYHLIWNIGKERR